MNCSILLTGIPRSGTTLCCRLLNSHPDTIALHEPIKAEEFDESNEPESVISKWIEDARDQLILNRRIVSKQLDGSIPDNPVGTGDGVRLRTERVSLGELRVSKPLSNDLKLIVKHNALFTSLLPKLKEKLTVFAIVRNPLSLLASWMSVDLPVNQGRIPMGERFDPGLKMRLDTQGDVLERQLLILAWFYESFARNLERHQIFSYEDLIESDGYILSRMVGNAFQPVPLEAQHSNASLDSEQLLLLAKRLKEHPEVYSGFYSANDIDRQFSLMCDS